MKVKTYFKEIGNNFSTFETYLGNGAHNVRNVSTTSFPKPGDLSKTVIAITVVEE